jgi:uncharacterized protein (TIRG00374 family)
VRAQQALARRLNQTWQAATVERFLDELFRGLDLIGTQPIAFGRLLVYQLGVILLDILTLYCAFRALGHALPLSVVVLGTMLANFFTTLVPLPGGGGSFETTLVLITMRSGVPLEVVLGATLIYRVLTFWLPLLLTAATYRHLLSQGTEVGERADPSASAPEHVI